MKQKKTAIVWTAIEAILDFLFLNLLKLLFILNLD